FLLRFFVGVDFDIPGVDLDFKSFWMEINVTKSRLYGVGVHCSDVQMMADMFGFLANNLPFTYLGVKVGANMARINTWHEVMQKVTSKLSKWKAKTLLVGGRLTLLKSVIRSLPTNYMSLFKVPDGVLNKLEGLRNAFFLEAEIDDRKVTWVCWKKSWRKNNMAAIYGLKGGLDQPIQSGNSVWTFIHKSISNLKSKGIDLMEFCKKAIENGNNSSFWHEKWIGDECFKVTFNRLYNLELQKDISITKKLQNSDFASSFRRRPRGGVEECQWNELPHMLSTVVLSPASDHWAWSLDRNGIFSVNLAREEIDKHFLINSSSSTRWSNLLPIQLNVLVWHMFLDKLPTRTNLSNRDMDIPCVLCSVCESEVESHNHLFFGCSLALDLFSLMER
nr:RNA-directed DNA polymerase, eukaryota, reverse transcriptase zinc-binding domain protein [Tanacetum cinerariifolium]